VPCERNGLYQVIQVKARHWAPIFLAVAALAIGLAGQDASTWLRYDRQAILAGQIWRLFTGHLVHLGWPHLLINLAGLALVWVLVGSALSNSRWALTTLACALAVSLGLLVLSPTVARYVGLSGVLHGLLAAGALVQWRSGVQRAGWILGVLALKLAWEQMAGPLPGSAATAGGRIIVDAHLYGALAGLLAAWLVPVAMRRLD
jgi:rhomboid family GlyGly-CTERM serine protease